MPDPSARARITLHGAFLGAALIAPDAHDANGRSTLFDTPSAVLEVLESHGLLVADALSAITPAARAVRLRATVATGGAPIGAWYAGNTAAASQQASVVAAALGADAESTAQLVAVAIAAGLAWEPVPGDEILREVVRRTPESVTRRQLDTAATIRAIEPPSTVAAVLADEGDAAIAQVVAAIWVATNHLHDLDAALDGARQLGGRARARSVGAIIGGLVAARVGFSGIPDRWRLQLGQGPFPVSFARPIA
jgi:hypothetical protein